MSAHCQGASTAGDPHTPPPPTGDGWQQYVNRLLTTHFTQQGHNYIAIPDKVSGDGGLEGFTTTGEAFQSYADEGSVSTADRSKKQKRKITTDLRKLADSKRLDYWGELLQDVKLSRWHLVVPVVEDKAVLVHAREKGEQLRKMDLPFLTADFQATVIAANETYPVAAKTLLQSGASFIPDGYFPSCEDDLAAFASARSDQVAKLDGKLTKVAGLQQEVKHKQARETILKRHLDSENLLARLKTTAPSLWEQILVQRQEHARNLEADAIFDSSPADRRVAEAKAKFCAAITSLTHAAVSTTAETIANGAIGLWLLECPLDFPEVVHA